MPKRSITLPHRDHVPAPPRPDGLVRADEDEISHLVPPAGTWWLYVLECTGGSLYTGITVDVVRRYDQHCRGVGATYTRLRPPIRLIGTMQAGNRSSALKLEYAFKRLTAEEKLARATAMGMPADV